MAGCLNCLSLDNVVEEHIIGSTSPGAGAEVTLEVDERLGSQQSLPPLTKRIRNSFSAAGIPNQSVSSRNIVHGLEHQYVMNWSPGSHYHTLPQSFRNRTRVYFYHTWYSKLEST
jgi:hypothetical protein